MSNGCPDSGDEVVFHNALPIRPRAQNGSPSEPSLGLDLQNINIHEHEVLISIQPPEAPRGDLKHTPCDIVLVIDISASMNTAAELPDADASGMKESSGWSILDLVKHACRTILEHLNEHDRLAVVTFSTYAEVVQGLLPMTQAEKKKTCSRIENLTVRESTNLWAGLRKGLDVFTETPSIGNAQGMYVLTDGVPNHMNPAQGFCKKLAPLLRGLESERGKAPIVSTFGFGYYLKSSLLQSIAEVGRGFYSFIPDAGMIGTVFVHAVANLFSTFATRVELTLECSNTFATIESPSYLEFNTVVDLNTTVLSLGNIRYGQSRDIIVRVSNAASADTVKATLRYQIPQDPRTSHSVQHFLDRPCTIPRTMVDYHVSRHDLCDFLSSLSTKSPQGEHIAYANHVIAAYHDVLSILVSSIESRLLNTPHTADTTDLEALLSDLKSTDPTDPHGHGQISLALQSTLPPLDPFSSSLHQSNPSSPVYRPIRAPQQPFYARWGRHYLPSILHAHASQIPITFKDPGPLRYCIASPLFIKCRDDLDDAFDRLPTLTPSLIAGAVQARATIVGGGGPGAAFASSSGGGGGAGQPTTITTGMSRYNRVGNPCFSGDSLVRYADDTVDYRVDEIRIGDILWTAAGGRMVRDIVCTIASSQELIGIRSGSESTGEGRLWITPWHPVFIDGAWVFPSDVQDIERKVVTNEAVYSFLLEDGGDMKAHTVEVGGVVCVTLGHGFTGFTNDAGERIKDARAHPFFGNYDAVMKDLERLDKDECGRRISGGLVARQIDGHRFSCGFVTPDEVYEFSDEELEHLDGPVDAKL